ncbi:hypothetical protein BpJC4_30410 [Weizmannia acidilactici]|nr:hypothetical protein [Weizmannia acidilactici]GER68570.1 hypothetical protein BpJC4_30410 [Weizmannia acidilactici]
MIEETIELDEKSLKEVKEPTQRVSAERLEKFAELVEQKVKEAESDAEQEKNKEIKKEKKAAYRLKRKIYKKLKEDYSPRLKKYEAQMEIFGDRNSYSKTDHDATFMRM